MFDEGVIRCADGTAFDLGDWSRVRYAALLRHLGFSQELMVIDDPGRAESICDEADAYETRLRQAALSNAAFFVAPALRDEVADAVLGRWRTACRAAGMTAATDA
jgi:hypothetical protein